MPRKPSSSLTPFNWRSRPSAWNGVTGAGESAVSFKTSTRIPPNPTTISGPNNGSLRAPTTSSIPCGTIGCPSTPLIRGLDFQHDGITQRRGGANRLISRARQPLADYRDIVVGEHVLGLPLG